MGYKYDKSNNCLRQLPGMDEPEKRSSDYPIASHSCYYWHEQWEVYSKHIATLTTLPLSGDVDWEDGKIVEEGKEFEIKNHFTKGNYHNICAKCKKEFAGADKLWFLCPEHSLIAIPIKEDEKIVFKMGKPEIAEGFAPMTHHTLNGHSLIAVDVPEDAERFSFGFDSPNWLYYYLKSATNSFDHRHIELPVGEYEILGRGRELTEEQWKGLVEKSQWGDNGYKEYEVTNRPHSWYNPTASGHSFLKANGISPDCLIIKKM